MTTTSTEAHTPVGDPRELYARAADVLAGVIAEVRPEQLGDPTPCADFAVRDLLGHVVGSTHGLAGVGEGGPGEDRSFAVREVPDDGWPALYEEGRSRFVAAWSDGAKLERPFAVPWGTVPGRGVLAGAVMESLAHAWDLARAIGAGPLPEQELAAHVLELTRTMVPAERRGPGVPFGPVREAPEGTDAYGRLAAWLGRDVTGRE
ncbi:TIGR03086 family metal-binding protein [Streptomyces sp. HNM0574]|uniref:TIGR03086 family metal-binding protein n=1 Tax=Streptomyces sp. HNM0574 TaxID=2714954 RepID=UPI00146C952D|nr:TIGR03086 family metal-binding protein [Streptomyces sp. HNM0574]NLU69636.1 TIGR03086 family protein [Streptomyces sp. HNM0574]